MIDPLWETWVERYDPDAGLYRVAVQDTIVASLTPRLWTPQGEQRYGQIYRDVASPEIPEAYPYTLAGWRLTTMAPEDSAPHLAVIARARDTRRLLRPYRRRMEWLYGFDAQDFEQQIVRAILEITRGAKNEETHEAGWAYTWTMRDLFGHLEGGYFAAVPRYVRDHFQRRVEYALRQRRYPRDVEGKILSEPFDPLDALEDNPPKGPPVSFFTHERRVDGIEMFRQELTAETRLLVDRKDAIPDQTTRIIVDILVAGGTLQEAATEVGLSTVTLRKRLKGLRKIRSTR